jgi:hypothetical protein
MPLVVVVVLQQMECLELSVTKVVTVEMVLPPMSLGLA